MSDSSSDSGIKKIKIKSSLKPDFDTWVLKFLKKNPSTTTGKLGFEFRSQFPEVSVSRKEINQILYKLLREKVITKTSNQDGSKPRWTLVSKNKKSESSDISQNISQNKIIKKLTLRVENLESELELTKKSIKKLKSELKILKSKN